MRNVRPEFLDYATMNVTSGSWYSSAAIGLRTCVDTDPAAISHLIPELTDQKLYAQSRKPMEMMVQGRASSLFQASQQ